MKREADKQARARELRRRGLSLRAIATQVDCSLSSASVWVRDVPKPEVHAAEPREESSAGSDPEPTRRCSRCRENLPVSAFNRNGDGYQWWCRECFRVYFRERGQLHRDQTAMALARRRTRAVRYVERVKAQASCADCGRSDPALIDFDHLRDKRASVSELAAYGYSIAALRREIAKCEPVCVNCHKRRTAKRAGWRRAAPQWWRTPPPLGRERARNLAYVYSLLERSACVDCGIRDMVVLEFDHVGSKTGNITHLASRGVSLERLQAEIAECEIRCGNCHRLRTYGELRRPQTAPLRS